MMYSICTIGLYLSFCVMHFADGYFELMTAPTHSHGLFTDSRVSLCNIAYF